MHTTFEQLLLKKLLGTITAEEEMDFALWLKANPPYIEMYKAREKDWAEKTGGGTGVYAAQCPGKKPT